VTQGKTYSNCEGCSKVLWEITVFDPQSLSFIQSVSLFEFVSLKGSVCDVYNVKLMKLWIASFHALCLFSFTFHLTYLSVMLLNVCVCVCVCVCFQHGCGPLQLNNTSLRDQEISTDIGNWTKQAWPLYTQWAERGRKCQIKCMWPVFNLTIVLIHIYNVNCQNHLLLYKCHDYLNWCLS